MWLVEDTCQLKPDSSTRDYPLCAEVRVSRNGEAGIVLVQVGKFRKGIVGPPQLYGAGVEEIDALVGTGSAERLSDFPALLDQMPIAPGVRKLYEEIVAHHPIGIPASPEKAVIWPLLSTRLTEQLRTAQACQDDYIRQHPNADQSSRPGWLRSGLFSGDGQKASPTSSVASSKEKQNDGSFLVNMQLGQGSMVLCGSHFWRVAARVIAEEGRPVVDDVRVYDCFSTDGPSRQLSDSFAGCDGPHWIGLDAKKK